MISPTPYNLPSLSIGSTISAKLRGDSSPSKASLIIGALDWALRCNIPFSDALLTLADKEYAPAFLNKVILPKKTDWDLAVNLSVRDLKRGSKLSDALKHMRKFMPHYLLVTIENAEEEQKLKELIPVLSKRIKFKSRILQQRLSVLAYPLMQLVMIIGFFSGLCVFIIPKFERIYEEMLGGKENLPPITRAVFHVQTFFNENVMTGMCVAAFSAVIFIFCFQLVPPFRRVIEEVMLKIPWVGNEYRNASLMEFSEIMACSLAVGNDIFEAAAFGAKTTKYMWLKSRLNNFVAKVEMGESWPDAWEEEHIGTPFYNWIIRNSASREDPIEGFSSLAAVIEERILFSCNIVTKMTEMGAILLNAVIVGFVVLGMGIALFSIYPALS